MEDLAWLLLLVAIVLGLVFLIAFAVGWLIQPRCPKCGRKKTFGPTGRQRSTTTSWNVLRKYNELQCSYCEYTEWKEIWRWRHGLGGRGYFQAKWQVNSHRGKRSLWRRLFPRKTLSTPVDEDAVNTELDEDKA